MINFTIFKNCCISHWHICVMTSISYTDDGAVRIWKNYNSEEFYDKKELVTSFQALNDMQPLARGIYSKTEEQIFDDN